MIPNTIKKLDEYCRLHNRSLWLGRDCFRRPAIVGIRKNDYPVGRLEGVKEW